MYATIRKEISYLKNLLRKNWNLLSFFKKYRFIEIYLIKEKRN